MVKGSKLSPEHREKLRAAHKRRKLEPGYLSGFMEAAHSQESIEKMRISLTGKRASPETRAKMSSAHIGRIHPCSPDTRVKIGLAMVGKKPSMESRTKMREMRIGRKPMLGKRHSPETCGEMSATHKKLFQDPAHCSKMRKAWSMKPNKPELKLLALLEDLYPGAWEYVGDFSHMINGKNPDFVNRDRSSVIELFGDYWHRGDDPADRAAIFAPFGYKTLVIWEHELKCIKTVTERIIEFNSTH